MTAAQECRLSGFVSPFQGCLQALPESRGTNLPVGARPWLLTAAPAGADVRLRRSLLANLRQHPAPEIPFGKRDLPSRKPEIRARIRAQQPGRAKQSPAEASGGAWHGPAASSRVGCVEQARATLRLRSPKRGSNLESMSPAPKADCADAPSSSGDWHWPAASGRARQVGGPPRGDARQATDRSVVLSVVSCWRLTSLRHVEFNLLLTI